MIAKQASPVARFAIFGCDARQVTPFLQIGTNIPEDVRYVCMQFRQLDLLFALLHYNKTIVPSSIDK